MRIARLVFSGIKARDAEHHLGEATLFNGPVASGKSTPLDAARYAALGFIPAIGAREADTAILMRAGSMSAEVALEDGRTFVRTLVRTGAKYSNVASAFWLEDATSTQAGQAIVSLFGQNQQEAAENLDLRALLDAGPSARAKKIEALLESSTDPEAAEWVVGLTLCRLDGRDLEPGAVSLETLRALGQSALLVLPEAVKLKLGPALSVEVMTNGIVATLSACNKAKNEASRTATSSIAARTAIEKRLGELPRPTETKTQLENQRSEAVNEYAEARRDLQERGRIERLILNESPTIRVGACPDAKEIEALGAEEEGLRAALKEAQGSVPPEPSRGMLEATLAAARTAYENALLAQRSPWRQVESLAQRVLVFSVISSDKEVLTPEYVSASLRSLAAKHGGSEAALEEEAELLGEKATAMEAAWKEATEQRESAERARDEIAAQLVRVLEARTRFIQLRAAHARINGLRDAMPTRSIEELSEVCRSAASMVTACETSLRELVEADARRSEMEAMARKVEQATAERDFYSAAEWACKAVRDRDMAARSGGLLRDMQTFLRAANRTEEPFIRTTKGDPEYGLVRGAKELPVAALSGGESVIFCAALAAAVIAARKPEVRLLMLEAAELGSSNVLLDCLQGCRGILRAGLIDQVLVATNAAVDTDAIQASGWCVIRTGDGR